MKINIVSDIHYSDEKNNIDFSKFNFDVDCFVCAGDLGVNSRSYYKCKNILRSYCAEKNCYFVQTPGNHDLWGSGNFFTEADTVTTEMLNSMHGVAFISIPLFTCLEDISFKPEKLGDFQEYLKAYKFELDGQPKCPEKMFNLEWNSIFYHSLECLSDRIWTYRNVVVNGEHMYKKIVVVTHHVPKKELIKNSVMYGHELNPYWASNDVFEILNNKPDVWIHGHSHEFCDMEIDGVRYIRNPLHDYDMKIMEDAYNYIIEI